MRGWAVSPILARVRFLLATETLSAALADRYIVERLIGEGGMATVYLARDVRHNRRVALKVLRPDLGAVVGVERFLAEIQVTANLQHPNLLPLFDSGAAGELLFYVMPYVQGESLRARLDREKQLPVEEAIRLATAIGGALDYAHRQGVIHRDLKPENVLLQEGQPLVADFGIALAVSNAGGTRITQTGLSLGTPHYMSPEQATGDRVIDGRTDIYSLGALAYEMLTGEPPHVGSTSQAIIARVLTEKPRPIRLSRSSVPEHVEAAVERALEKLPADRWASTREFCEALAGTRPVTRTSTSATSALPAASTTPSRSARPKVRELVAWTLAVAGIAAGVWGLTRPAPEPPPMSRLAVEVPDTISVTRSTILEFPSVAVSPDGKTIAFVGTPLQTARVIGTVRLYVRATNDIEVRELAGTDGASQPVFSPDGSYLAYVDSHRNLRTIPTAGGTPQLLTEAGSVSWADDGLIYFTLNTGLWVIAPGGGAPRLLVAGDTTNLAIQQVHVLPGSRMALARIRHAGLRFSIGVIDLGEGTVHDLEVDGDRPRYAEPGYLLYTADEGGVIMAVPFSLRSRSITGPAVRIAEGGSVLNNGGVDYGMNDRGTIVFRWSTRDALEPTALTRFDRSGRATVVREDALHYDQPRLSPDGRHLLVRVGGAFFNEGDLWVIELASGAMTRLTSGNVSYRATWSRDGSRVYYISGAPGTSRIMMKPWDGSGADSVVLDRPGTAEFAEGPRGGWSAIRTYGARDILLLPTDSLGVTEPRPFVTGPANESDMVISPSGNLMAYQSDETGRFEVYLRPVPGPGPRLPVSINGGSHPVWAPDGGTLYFRNGPVIMSAGISESPVAVSRRDSLFSAPLKDEGMNFAVYRDGRGLIGAVQRDQRQTNPFRLAVVTGWQSLMQGAATTR